MRRATTTTNEFGKVLARSGVPAGPSPSWSVVRAGWRSHRPPTAVVVAGALGAVTVGAFVALAALVLVRAVVGDGGLVARLVVTLLLAGILLGLAALAWRGVLRGVHLGETAGLRFPATLVGILCVPIGAFLLFWTQVRGNPVEPSMAAPFLFWALTLLPLPFLALPAARAWPDAVQLRRGPTVRSRLEAAAFLEARPHGCGRVLDPPAEAWVPVTDAERTGVRLTGSCPHCGQPVDYLLADAPEEARARPGDHLALGAPGSRSALGGGDLHHLGRSLAVPADLDPAAADDPTLQRQLVRGAVAAQATADLLELVPPRRRSVPFARRSGRPAPLLEDTAEFSRAVLAGRVAERRAGAAAVREELLRRGGTPPALPW